MGGGSVKQFLEPTNQNEKNSSAYYIILRYELILKEEPYLNGS